MRGATTPVERLPRWERPWAGQLQALKVGRVNVMGPESTRDNHDGSRPGAWAGGPSRGSVSGSGFGPVLVPSLNQQQAVGTVSRSAVALRPSVADDRARSSRPRTREEGDGVPSSAAKRANVPPPPLWKDSAPPGAATLTRTKASKKLMKDQLLNYTLLEVLGKGAGSTIYRGRDNDTGRIVALKHVERAKPKDLRFIQQMETEYEVSRHFSHPGLRRAFQLKVSKSLLVRVTEAVLVLEYVEAQPLERSLPPDLLSVVQTFIDVADALGAMHRMGWAHCDIKPNNILRSKDGKVKVIDFGQSCRIGTIKQRIQGTPDYIAPEQVDRLPISESTDVFNLGATLYWAATGQHVPTAYHTKRKGANSFLVDSLFKSPRDLNPEVPKPISEVVMQCVATRQKSRPQTMDEVVRKLQLGLHILQRDQGSLTNPADDPLVNDTRI